VVVATGARYRRLALEGFERFEGQGIHYAATAMEAQLCAGEEVVVVGGGNSAGQAAVFLASAAGRVRMLIRGEELAATMSDYLIERIRRTPAISVHPRTEVTELAGDNWLREVVWTDRATGEATRRRVSNLFLMIGAEPNSGWLRGCVRLDDAGFVTTGRDEAGQPLASEFATSRAGVFAVGDVRAGSVKRVASAVGEGSVAVQAVHRFLAP
jgi:thioredoxin reductase (NADPH)